MKKIFILIVLFLTPLSSIYCNNSTNLEKLTVILDWFPNPDHAPIFVAEQQGFFKELGLSVELIGPADPADPPKLVAAGKADIAITYEPQFMEQVDQGLPLIRIGTLINKPLDSVIVLKESNIKSMHDLKAKRIGYSTGDIASLKVMLSNNGVNIKDVLLINVHYDLTQALLTRKLDAASGMMRNFELIQLEIMQHPGLAFYPEKNGVPIYNELIFVTRSDNTHDPKLKKFLLALKKGVYYLQSHPEESWRKFAQSHPELNDELNHRSWFVTIPYFAKNPEQFDSTEWLNFARFMQKNGLIKKVQATDVYAVDIINNK